MDGLAADPDAFVFYSLACGHHVGPLDKRKPRPDSATCGYCRWPSATVRHVTAEEINRAYSAGELLEVRP